MRVTSMRARQITLSFAALAGTIGIAFPAFAQETTTYTYDALGRVTGVVHSGGPANGTSSAYTYDPASNRTNVTVTGSPNGTPASSNADSGASVPTAVYVVVPLNGFTLITVTK